MPAEHSTASGAPASGIMWLYRFGDDGSAVALPCEKADEALAMPGGWCWVHLGLADARAQLDRAARAGVGHGA